MKPATVRIAAAGLLLVALAACSPRATTSPVTGPAGQPSTSDVNPITGSRGGSGGK